MHTRTSSLVVAAALVAGFAPAWAQDTPVDPRWIAYFGCWQPVGTGKSPTLCVVPAADMPAVDLVTIEKGEVVKAEQLIASGARTETTRGECTGWQSAEWSAVSDRLYLHMEESCPGWGTRTGSGVITLTPDRHLLYIQGSTVGMKTGVQVQRYRAAMNDSVLPSEVKDALHALDLDLRATAQAHATASALLAMDDVVEATRQLDAEVVEAWLIERGGAFPLDAKRLVALANAGVPSRITDLMIALAYPGVFTIDDVSHRGGARRGETKPSYADGAGEMYPFSPYGSCWMDYCDGYAGLYPYGYDLYPYSYPVVIIYNGSVGGGGSSGGGSTHSHGRVVNGQGYEEGLGANADVGRRGEPRSTGETSASTMRANPGTSSSSAGEQRTAKPRP